MQTSIIVSPFHYRRPKLFRQHLLKKRKVFVHQLFLQILCSRRDHHASAAAACRCYSGHQIRERLARAGPRFDDQMMLLFEGVQHRLSHFNLARTMLVFGMSFGDYAVRTEDCLHSKENAIRRFRRLRRF